MTRIYRYSDITDNHFRFLVQMVTLRQPYFAEHTHEFSELVLILGGSGQHIDGNERYPIVPGDVFVINGNRVHGFYDAAGLTLCNIMYDPDDLLPGHHDLRRLPGYHALFALEPFYRQQHQFQSKLHLDAHGLRQAAILIDKIQEELTQRIPGFETLIRGLFAQMVVFLARSYANYTQPHNRPLPELADVVAYMEEKFAEPLRLDDLAARAVMSSSHFVRVFKMNFKTTPIDYLIRLRIDHAKKLLGDTKLPLTQIAQMTGFGDSNYFARQFKQISGQTPSQYRAMARRFKQ